MCVQLLGLPDVLYHVHVQLTFGKEAARALLGVWVQCNRSLSTGY